MNLAHTLGVLVCVFAISCGQVLFKRLGLEIEAGSSLGSWKVVTTAITAILIYGSATLLWVYLLRFVPLNKAYLFMSLSFVLVPIAGYYFFAEKFSYGNMAGAMLIIIGIIISSKFG